jgi:hypothetical protein
MASSLRSTEEDNSVLTEQDLEWLRKLGSGLWVQVPDPIYVRPGVYKTRFIREVWRKGKVRWEIEDWPADPVALGNHRRAPGQFRRR